MKSEDNAPAQPTTRDRVAIKIRRLDKKETTGSSSIAGGD